MTGKLDRLLNVADFRKQARRRMPRPIYAYLDGGAEDECTLDRNRLAFDEYGLLPSALNDVRMPMPATTIMGTASDWPFVVAPTGMPGLFHPDAEGGLARAAADAGIIYCLSTMASMSIEAVAAATSAPKFFQLYIFRDRSITRELIQRARLAGYQGLILTVDIQVPANRERDKRSGLVIPPKPRPSTLLAMARRPAWCWDVLVRQPVKLANFEGRRADPGSTLLQFINDQFDPASTWRDVEWVCAEWGGPVAIKGLLSPVDVALARDAGAQAVILSNHGGRQLDGAVAPLEMLSRACDAADGKTEIILDGGVRRGSDMIKALCLGASACMAGRPGLYGLATAGYAGAARVFDLLRREFIRDLQMMGATRIAQLDRSGIMTRRAAQTVPPAR